MNSAVHPLPNAPQSWLRWCSHREDVRVSDYLEGFVLLEGPHAAEWLARGFDDLLKTVQNGSAA
jgi:hypothetical protein